MSRPSAHPRELRERAVRMVAELRPNYESEFAATTAVANKPRTTTAETVRKWVRRSQVDAGQCAGRHRHGSAALNEAARAPRRTARAVRPPAP